MKIIYTDRYALRLWAFAFLTIWMGYKGLANDTGWFQVATLFAAAISSYLAIKEFNRRRTASLSGSDPSIYKVVDNAEN
jgi:hypothetical protein